MTSPLPLITTLPRQRLASVRFILTDVDDTLTWESQLPLAAYQALAQLQQVGIAVIPVTGGCAGWADMIARLWPVKGVICEGGGCYLYKNEQGQLRYDYWQAEPLMRQRQQQLLQQVQAVLADYPPLRLAQDQHYRLTDVAIDYAQDQHPPQPKLANALLKRLQQLQLTAKASSIHINVSQGGYDKWQMSERVLQQHFGLSQAAMAEQVLYVGDAPNDEPMFARFPLSVGVANIQSHLATLAARPGWLTGQPGGYGFAELATWLVSQQDQTA